MGLDDYKFRQVPVVTHFSQQFITVLWLKLMQNYISIHHIANEELTYIQDFRKKHLPVLVDLSGVHT